VTALRKRMLEDLQRRNYNPDTIRGYILAVEQFAKHFDKSPELMGVEEIGQFQLHLLRERKLSVGTIAPRMGALRFLYKKTLKRRDMDFDDLPLLRTPKKLPVVLSPDEVTRLIEAAPNLLYRTLLMLLYATGLRRAEAANLKVSDIDSSLMLIHVRQGKGSRDRELPLTQKVLGALRDYWPAAQMKPCVYLFPGRRGDAAEEQPTSDKTVWLACHESALRAGILKRVGPHTLRHYTASRTMPRVKLWIFYLGLSLRFLRHSPTARLPRWMNDKKGIHFPKNDGTAPSGAFEQVSRCLFGGPV
jgi:integrase/recombinase XerD